MEGGCGHWENHLNKWKVAGRTRLPLTPSIAQLSLPPEMDHGRVINLQEGELYCLMHPLLGVKGMFGLSPCGET